MRTSLTSWCPFFVVLLVSGCAPALVQDRSPNGGSAAGGTTTNTVVEQESGLQYWLPVDVAVVQATVTKTVTREIVLGEVNQKPALVTKTSTKAEREGTLSVRTLADRGGPAYTLDIKPGRLRDTSLGIEVSSAGLLRSVSPASTGRAGNVIQAVARFVGTGLSLATGLPFLPLKLDAQKWSVLQEGPLKLALKCDPFEEPFTTLPLRVRAFVSKSEEGCGLLLEIMQREAALKRHEQQRMELELTLETVSEQELPKLRERIQAIKAAIRSTQAELTARQARFAALLEAFVADQELGVTSRADDYALVLQLNEIPASAGDLSKAPYENARKFFGETGIVVTAQVVTGPPEGPATPGARSRNSVRIFYRQSLPIRFRIEASRAEKPELSNLQLLSETIADVVMPGTTAHYVDFDSSAFADRKLTLTFDDRGRPLRLERSGTSAGAAVAVAVSDATRAVRDEYASGLAKVAEIQATQQKLQANEITAQLEDLKKRKEILEAQLALESGTQNFQTLLEQQQLQADIALLEARQSHTNTTENAAQRLEIETLKLQLEQVKAQLEILKAQQEIEKLTKR
jgi:hypothetical protein